VSGCGKNPTEGVPAKFVPAEGGRAIADGQIAWTRSEPYLPCRFPDSNVGPGGQNGHGTRFDVC
jgi:hypothetical protein